MLQKKNMEDSGVMSSSDSNVDKTTYYKDLLKGRIFLGRYMERRLVDENVGYRDIIALSPAEKELERDLMEAQYSIQSLHSSPLWIGVTDSLMLNYNPPSLCLWTEIDNQPFGVFWFQIKTIQFRINEVIIKVKCLRHITDAFLEAEPILTGLNKTERRTGAAGDVSLDGTLTDFKDTLKEVFTLTNIKEFIRFVIVFIIAIFTGSVAFINFLGNFFLSLVREGSFFVNNSTPMVLGFLNFLSKIVGGFYLLLAMLFRQTAPPSTSNQHNNRYPPIGSHPYDDKSFD